MKPLDRAVYWIEYIIRHGRAEHLISDSIELNEMQYFLFDVILILIVPLGCIAWMCYLFVVTITSKLL